MSQFEVKLTPEWLSLGKSLQLNKEEHPTPPPANPNKGETLFNSLINPNSFQRNNDNKRQNFAARRSPSTPNSQFKSSFKNHGYRDDSLYDRKPNNFDRNYTRQNISPIKDRTYYERNENWSKRTDYHKHHNSSSASESHSTRTQLHNNERRQENEHKFTQSMNKKSVSEPSLQVKKSQHSRNSSKDETKHISSAPQERKNQNHSRNKCTPSDSKHSRITHEAQRSNDSNSVETKVDDTEFISEEEEQRLLRELGWTPPKEGEEPFDDWISPGEIESTLLKLSNLKPQCNAKSESLEEIIRNWQRVQLSNGDDSF